MSRSSIVAVRCGGHSIPGFSTCDDGIVIDLSRMRGVDVDPEQRTARVRGGSLLAELDDAAQAHGLVCPVGVVSHTGVAGLTLGGGMGRLQRKLGLTIDSLLAVELVTADGQVVRASEDENPELFWGMRGAGANFGIVTSFEFHLHPFEGVVTHGTVTHPIERAEELAERYRELVGGRARRALDVLRHGRRRGCSRAGRVGVRAPQRVADRRRSGTSPGSARSTIRSRTPSSRSRTWRRSACSTRRWSGDSASR